MSDKPLVKFGIFGLGFIGKMHAQAANSLPFCVPDPQVDLRVAALLRRNAAGDEAFIQSVGNPAVYTDINEFLAQDLDFVDICSPNHAHLPQTLAAAEAGKNIYCEKPLARDMAEAEQMLAAVKAAGVKTHTAMSTKSLP